MSKSVVTGARGSGFDFRLIKMVLLLDLRLKDGTRHSNLGNLVLTENVGEQSKLGHH